MIVNVSGLVATHPLELARQMAARRTLGTYYTAVPSSRTRRVPVRKTRRHLSLLLPLYASRQQWAAAVRDSIYWHVNCEFDRWMSERLGECDVQQCLSGCGLRTLRRARADFGAVTVCDATTSHVTFGDVLLAEEAKTWGTPYTRVQSRFADRLLEEYNAADLLTVPSEFARRTFEAQGFARRRIEVTPYGVDLSDYSQTRKRDDVFRVLFVGTLSVRKGLGYLFQALSKVRLSNAELALRGADTVETETLFRLAPPDLPINRIPPQQKSQMKDVFSQASVVVLPSIEDAFGLVICQAMACGVPVIASVNSGGPDVISDGTDGFIVPIRDPQAIADRIQLLHDQPSLRSCMGSAAAAKVRGLGGWDRYGDSVLSAYARARLRGSDSAGIRR